METQKQDSRYRCYHPKQIPPFMILDGYFQKNPVYFLIS